ncbi:hypothetical protein KAJ89_03805 [Candidatus Parcubacteria bacterium]|nr:hypothetical protein [Candidatus Parcubacteria bacterium]
MGTNRAEELEREKQAVKDALENLGTNQYVYDKERKALNKRLKEVNDEVGNSKLQVLDAKYKKATGQSLRANTLSTVRC